jgi:SAM-dependent methyltransferase
LHDLPVGARILEVGCGGGQFIRSVKQHLPNSLCYGFDISKSAIEWANQHDKSVTYVAGTSLGLPWDDNYFDAVLIFDVLEHVDSVDKTLNEIKRVLKTNGIFYAFVPCEGDRLSLWYHLRRWKNLDNLTFKYAGHINRYSKDRWLKIFDQFNFSVSKLYYGEHFLGQIIGVIAFCLMDRRAKKQNLSQLNNESYFQAVAKESKIRIFFNILRDLVNSLIYIESSIFSKIPSPNVHFFLKKNK